MDKFLSSEISLINSKTLNIRDSMIILSKLNCDYLTNCSRDNYLVTNIFQYHTDLQVQADFNRN